MPTYPFNIGIWATISLAGLVHAHIGPWTKGMYCINGSTPGVVNYNNADPVQPLYMLRYDQFWNHAENNCDKYPPNEGDFLEVPSNGSFTVELASNLACTTLHPNPKVTDWGDGIEHPDNYGVGNLGGLTPTPGDCIPSPNLHAQNESMAAGTAFGISYESDIKNVTPNNTVVFTVKYNTPYKRVTTYEVPPHMPPCPEGGCHCIFGWIPRGCGEPNMYLFPIKCKVIPDGTQPKTIGTPKPAVWCEGDPSKCVQGPKQMLMWNQAERNNIEVDGYDLSGLPKSPAYNERCGFADGAQDDIFVSSTPSFSKCMARMRRDSIF